MQTQELDRSLARPPAAVASLLAAWIVFLFSFLVQEASAASVTACVAKKGTVKTSKAIEMPSR